MPAKSEPLRAGSTNRTHKMTTRSNRMHLLELLPQVLAVVPVQLFAALGYVQT